jgi:SAM-dependent methyltransferase
MRFPSLISISFAVFATVCLAQKGGDNPAAIFDKIYASEAPPFNAEPSAFLARAVDGVAPGKALDVAMGQGRNSLFLARKGWQVTGYDVSTVGLSQAQAAAAKAGLKIETVQKSHADFDFGTDRWDLVVMVFPGTSMDDLELLRKIKTSMKKGAMIVVEQFNAPPGEGAKGPANALFQTFAEFRVMRYEDIPDVSDWGRMKARIGRVAAVKE